MDIEIRKHISDFRIELKLYLSCIRSMREGRWELCRDNSFIRSMRDAGEGTADRKTINNLK